MGSFSISLPLPLFALHRDLFLCFYCLLNVPLFVSPTILSVFSSRQCIFVCVQSIALNTSFRLWLPIFFVRRNCKGNIPHSYCCPMRHIASGQIYQCNCSITTIVELVLSTVAVGTITSGMWQFRVAPIKTTKFEWVARESTNLIALWLSYIELHNLAIWTLVPLGPAALSRPYYPWC